jgi:hypothetical protein
MMAKRIQMISGDEYDALTRAKRFFDWRAGERKRIKRNYRKRERAQAKQTIVRCDGGEPGA